MSSHSKVAIRRLLGLALAAPLTIWAALPAHAQDSCPCFAAEEITQICQSIGGLQSYGPSRGWGGLLETEGAAIECSSADSGEGAYFMIDARPMSGSSRICTKNIARGTQDDVLQTDGIFKEHFAACHTELEKAAELLGGLKFLRFEP